MPLEPVFFKFQSIFSLQSHPKLYNKYSMIIRLLLGYVRIRTSTVTQHRYLLIYLKSIFKHHVPVFSGLSSLKQHFYSHWSFQRSGSSSTSSFYSKSASKGRVTVWVLILTYHKYYWTRYLLYILRRLCKLKMDWNLKNTGSQAIFERCESDWKLIKLGSFSGS